MKLRRRVAILRRIRQLAAERAARADGNRVTVSRSDRFQPLTEAETAAILGDELLRSLGRRKKGNRTGTRLGYAGLSGIGDVDDGLVK